jgi:hypothetical protein
MATKTVIVHPSCIEREMGRSYLDDEGRQKCRTALGVIAEVLSKARRMIIVDELPRNPETRTLKKRCDDGDVYVLWDIATEYLKRCVRRQDEVTVIGAYRWNCVNTAVKNIKKTGAHVEVNEDGTVE